MNKHAFLPPFMVGLGAIFYGIPASLYKLAEANGIHTNDMVIWIYIIATLVLNGLGYFIERKKGVVLSFKRKLQLIAAGLPVALTSVLYVLALHFTSVTIVAVMLMQSVWLAIVLGALQQKQWPSKIQVIGVCFILIGTVIAAGLFPLQEAFSIPGMLLSLGGAFSYAVMIQLTAGVGNDFPPITKARFMSSGSLILILLFWGPQITSTTYFLKALPWGMVGSIFSMIVPLLAYAYYMPKLPLGIGPILSALELPFSMIFAFLILKEKISPFQVLGVSFIIGTIILVNLLEAKQIKKATTNKNL